MGSDQQSCRKNRKSASLLLLQSSATPKIHLVETTVFVTTCVIMIALAGSVRSFTAARPSFHHVWMSKRARIFSSCTMVEKPVLGTSSSFLQQRTVSSVHNSLIEKAMGKLKVDQCPSSPFRRINLRLAATTTTATQTTSETGSGSTTSTTRPLPTTSKAKESFDVLNNLNGLASSFDPSSFEKDVYHWWESSGCFLPYAKHAPRVGERPYVLPMPPPNVTGRLHMGHAMFVALQDILARFHRMRGRPVLWLPGTDHAGIATQLQVEKQLLVEGTTRTELGRDEFLRRVWTYKEEQGGHITRQLRSLGASADWTRERFTMDKDMSEAVTEAFVRFHEKGLVYRGEYMVNWAPQLQTAVSDLEVEYAEEQGKLYFFKYMVKDSDEYIPVATTRPETICGDAAVCVHTSDDRYKHLVGKSVVVPMGNGRVVPVIADDYVDREFGTGALKITPGHDPNDYALGSKHNLPIINIMNKDGSMNANAGQYNGLDRFECREKLWADMEEAELTIRVQPHTQRIPRSQRGGEVIEPLVSRQWFVKTEGMGAKALEAVTGGDIQILPQRFNKMWANWLEGIRDWCVSRQLWWGHRIPVWYIGESGDSDYVVARNEEAARAKAVEQGHASTVTLRQEEDVLDTWFSSGLWPFASVGWPQSDQDDEDSDLSRFYPAACLETGHDILFFWVARMVMMGLELTGKSPFNTIYLHGLVLASDGSKMSKTKGNVIDPLDTVATYGADSLRYSLVTGVTPGQDVPLNMEKIQANRNFANKLWNCCKFVTGNALKDMSADDEAAFAVTGPIGKEEFDSLPLPERFIVSKCHSLVESVTKDIESYQLGAAGSKVYEFLWDQYADWYVEISKTRLYETLGGDDAVEAKAARRVLVYVLDTSLRLLHPYMPYVTEVLWHHLPRAPKDDHKCVNAVMLADWPQMDDDIPLVSSEESVDQFECFQALTRSIRNARAEYNVEPGKRISAIVIASGKLREALEKELKSLVSLAKLDPDQVSVVEAGLEEAHEEMVTDSVKLVIRDGVEAYLPLSGLVDPEKERKRLEKQREKLEKAIEKLAGRLQSTGFLDKAPPSLVETAKTELSELEDQAAKVNASLEALQR